MQKTLPALAIALLMAGCQSVSPDPATDISKPEPVVADMPMADDAVQEPAAPLPPTDVWERIRSQMAMEVPDNARVEKFRQWYLEHPNHLKIVSQRAQPFLYLIVEEIERRGLPIELALLPIVESSFDVFAYSHGAAAGIWQFTSPTAKSFGLKRDWWYDGRRDVYAATIAAMDMMEYLHNKLDNNWNYALAAYNTGEGRVMRSVRRNKQAGKPTDFFSLDLPRETERYVPQLLALADVVKNAESYGIELLPVANSPALEPVDVGSQIDLALAADMAGMELSDLHKLNPGYNRWATSPDGPHRLLLPLENAETFRASLAKTDPKDRIRWVRYEVKSGDTLGTIAQAHHTRIAVLQSVNQLDGNLIRIGQALLIPVAAQDPEAYTLSADQRLARKQSGKGMKIDYRVQPGDSFWSIARAHKVSVKQLASWNSMAPSDTLGLGKKLVIWTGKSNGSAVMRKVQYKVRPGDSLARIGKKFQVKVSDVVKWNQLQGQKYLQPGQRLTLYVDVTQISG